MLRMSSFYEFLVHFEMCVERQRCQVTDGVRTVKLVDESVLALGRLYHILIFRLRPHSNNGGDRTTEKTLPYLDGKSSQLTRRSLMLSSSSLFFLLMSEHHSFGILPFMSAFFVLMLKFYCFHSYFYPIMQTINIRN